MTGTDSGSGPTRQTPGKMPSRERESPQMAPPHVQKTHNLHNVSYKTPALPV